MKTAGFFALFLAAVSLTSTATADYTVQPGKTMKAAKSTLKHAKFVKQFTLAAGSANDAITALDFDLAGRVFVSYVDDLPIGVVGYVNVTGSSKIVVDAVKVVKESDDNDDDDDLFDLDDALNNDRGELNVRIGRGATNPVVNGYLLTEIFLPPGTVNEVKSSRSGEVIIEEDVLVTDSKTAELQIEASSSSSVFVSDPEAAVNVRQFSLGASGTASIEVNVQSVVVHSEAQIETQGAASISLLSSSLKTKLLDLDAERSSTICIAAEEVTAKRREVQGGDQISLPNSANKFGSTGAFECDETAILPAREPALCKPSASGNTVTDDDDSDNDDNDDLFD